MSSQKACLLRLIGMRNTERILVYVAVHNETIGKVTVRMIVVLPTYVNIK